MVGLDPISNLWLVQGFAILPEGGVKLISEVVEDEMKIPVSVLMGANLANEVIILYNIHILYKICEVVKQYWYSGFVA